MAVYISNLVAGLDKGLDHTELLLEMTGPFGGYWVKPSTKLLQ